MKKVTVVQHPDVPGKFESYPEEIREKLLHLRSLILECAEELKIDKLEETLKWSEPSYIAPKGSTIRMDWKKKTPEQYAIYFKCTSKLVPSFKKRYSDTFKFEKNRAILFGMEDEVPAKELKDCISLALEYHLIKQTLKV